MVKRNLIFFMAMLTPLLVCAPAWAQGNSSQHPIFTYVSLWGVPRAQWGDMAKINAADKADLDPQVANGTLTGYGMFENRVHSDNGYTHGSWFQANSLGSLLKGLEVPYNSGFVTAPVLAASKHQDYLMISTIYGGTAVTNTTGYLRVVSTEIQAGKMDDFREIFRHYLVPVYEKLVSEGAIVAYQLDTEYNIENAPGRVFVVVTTRDGDAMDKVRMAVGELFEKNPAVVGLLAAVTVPNSRNDLLAHIIAMTRK